METIRNTSTEGSTNLPKDTQLQFPVQSEGRNPSNLGRDWVHGAQDGLQRIAGV